MHRRELRRIDGLDAELSRIEKQYDLDEPEVIAGIATCADVAAAQRRLVARPATALVHGLLLALARPLRPTAKLLAQALLDGAQREMAAPTAAPVTATSRPKGKAMPVFARVGRLPPLLDDAGRGATRDEVEALLQALAKSKLGRPPESATRPSRSRAPDARSRSVAAKGSGSPRAIAELALELQPVGRYSSR